MLPHWATVFRASGAALQLRNQKLLTTSCQLQAASYHGKIPIRIWAATDRPEFERLMLNTNPHPLARLRAIAAPSNMQAFSQAFGCKEGDALVRPAAIRCQIW